MIRSKIKTPEQLQALVDAYFEECAGVATRTKDGNLVVNEYGRVCYDIAPHPPTMAGLSYFCGFAYQEGFGRQKRRGAAFKAVVDRARLRVENYLETALYDRNSISGAKFNLICNFGWNAKDDEPEPAGINIIIRQGEPVNGSDARAYAGTNIAIMD